RWTPSTWQIRIGLLLLLIATVLGWILLIGPTDAQFRLDTGDVRYIYSGIPGRTLRMDEPERSTIVSLASGSTVLKTELVSVPHQRALNSQLFGQKMFYRAARWATVNPQMSKALLEDMALYLKGAQLPQATLDMLLWFEPIGPGVW